MEMLGLRVRLGKKRIANVMLTSDAHALRIGIAVRFKEVDKLLSRHGWVPAKVTGIKRDDEGPLVILTLGKSKGK